MIARLGLGRFFSNLADDIGAPPEDDEPCATCAGTGRYFLTGDTKKGGVKVCSYGICPKCKGSGLQ